MNVVVLIEGREAIPVRAIPLICKWRFMSPDELVLALSGDRVWFRAFIDLFAYRYQGSSITAISSWVWESMEMPKIKAVESRLKAAELTDKLTDDEAYASWQKESLLLLPSGVFLWKDEFESAFLRKYGVGNISLLDALTDEEHKKLITLDFNRSMYSTEMQMMLMEGFESVAIPAPTGIGQIVSPPSGIEKMSGEKPNSIDWKALAKTRALAIIKEHKLRDTYPSQEIVADTIANEFRNAFPQVVGSDGKPLTGASIKRHALKGITSAQGKQLSMKTSQGK